MERARERAALFVLAGWPVAGNLMLSQSAVHRRWHVSAAYMTQPAPDRRSKRHALVAVGDSAVEDPRCAPPRAGIYSASVLERSYAKPICGVQESAAFISATLPPYRRKSCSALEESKPGPRSNNPD